MFLEKYMIIACCLLIEKPILGSLTRTGFTSDRRGGFAISTIFICLGSCFVLQRMPCVTGSEFEEKYSKMTNWFFCFKTFRATNDDNLEGGSLWLRP